MSKSPDGFYVAYLTATVGQGLEMLIFKNGNIIGTDVPGTKYDGTYENIDAGFSIRLIVSALREFEWVK